MRVEAEWLRHEMNPKRVVRRFAREHTAVLLITALAAGIAIPLVLLSRRQRHATEIKNAVERHRPASKEADKTVKMGVMAYLGGMLMKQATPLLIREGLRAWNRFRAG